jgi:hypothetical protein
MNGFNFGDRWSVHLPRVSNHAIDRAIQRFKVSHKTASKWVIDHLRESRFISSITGIDGKHAYLFSCRDVGLVVSDDLTTIMTVIVPNNPRYHSAADRTIRERFVKLARTELRKAETVEQRVKRINERTIAELNVEIAQLTLALTRLRSQAKILAYKARIAAISMRIDELKTEAAEATKQHCIVAKTVAGFVS